MRITEITTLFVDGYYRNPVFVEVETDAQTTGWGECSLEGKDSAVQGAVADYARELGDAIRAASKSTWAP